MKAVYRACAQYGLPAPDPREVNYFDAGQVQNYLAQSSAQNEAYDREVAAMTAPRRR